MILLLNLAFVAVNALGNKIRGGLLAHRFGENVWFAQIQKGIASAIMLLSLVFLLGLSWLNAAIITAGWFLFLLFPWGPYFDFGHNKPQPERKDFLTPIYEYMLKHYGSNQVYVDTVMMFLRGLYSVVLMGAVAFVSGNWWVAALTVPLAFTWMLVYRVDRTTYPFMNYAEYYAGAVMAVYILLGLYW